MNVAIAHQIHAMPMQALIRAVQFRGHFDSFYELRQEFAGWANGSRENFASWQDAWNTWTRATRTVPGSVRFRVKCFECRGRGWSIRTRHGAGAGICPGCLGRKTVIANGIALWQKPPDEQAS